MDITEARSIPVFLSGSTLSRITAITVIIPVITVIAASMEAVTMEVTTVFTAVTTAITQVATVGTTEAIMAVGIMAGIIKCGTRNAECGIGRKTSSLNRNRDLNPNLL
jgi:hypothetical protein